RTAEVFFFVVILAIGGTSVVTAQPPSPGTAPYTQYGEPPVMDNAIFYHLLLDQLEGRTNGPENEFRWDGEGWIGTDMNKLRVRRRPVAGVAGDGVVVLSIDSPDLGCFFCSCTDNCYVPYCPLRGHCSAPDETGRTGLEYWLGNLDGCNHRGHGVVGALAVRAARFLEE